MRKTPRDHLDKTAVPDQFGVEIFILAGGLSTRMGRDKSRLRLGRRTMLGHIRAVARQLGYPVRTVHRDAVPRCGPLGGIYTGLRRARAGVVLFLACDMPFISTEFLSEMISGLAPSVTALFASENGRAGFPCVLRRIVSPPIVMEQIAKSALSLQSLAKSLNAKTIRPSPALAHELTNVNSPREFAAALSQYRATLAKKLDSCETPPIIREVLDRACPIALRKRKRTSALQNLAENSSPVRPVNRSPIHPSSTPPGTAPGR